MGIYYQLNCTDCGQFISFGKKIHKNHRTTLQGLYSDLSNKWLADEKAFGAVATFLLQHEGHRLCFTQDSTSEAQELEEIDLDKLVGMP